MTAEPPPPPQGGQPASPQPQPGGWQPRRPEPPPGSYGTPPPGGAMPPPGTPYAPGYSALTTTELAGFWRRFLAYIIDAIIVGLVAGVIHGIITAAIRASSTDTGAFGREGLIGLVIGLAYFGYFWSRGGQTPGYMALGIRVIRTAGEPLSLGAAMIRYFLIYLSFALCLIPAIISAFMIGLSQRKQALHDLMVGTVVVRA